MKIGKVSESVLKRSVLKLIKKHRKEMILPAGIGEDCGAICSETETVYTFSTSPVFLTKGEGAAEGVYRVTNDLYASGARPLGIMLDIMLPENAREIAIKRVMQEVEEVCQEHNIQVLGGNTQVTDAVNCVVVSMTGIGQCAKKELCPTKNFSVGDFLVMTKYAGSAGASVLVREQKERLLERYTESFLQRAEIGREELSVEKEAIIAQESGVTSMHNLSDGGIYGALWEVASASGIGFEVELDHIAIRQETVEVSEVFDMNPYQLRSTGSLLIGTKDPEALVEKLKNAGISAEIIGKMVAGNDKVIIRDGERSCLEPIKGDELVIS